MRLSKNPVTLLSAAVAALMTADLQYVRGTELGAPAWKALRRCDVSHGGRSKQTTAQNKRAARKAKNVKRHRRACRG